ncbi:MAG: hypothetical protein QN174_12305 [Armatimonadota bacterium]|nr:hypothetical protein [Armatimonadota bacterium]MDR7421114.1 hypothetical protein [Armatimonadota bacterium]MDR7497726.1 hypothetical protein [Armatimonadota bacterium]
MTTGARSSSNEKAAARAAANGSRAPVGSFEEAARVGVLLRFLPPWVRLLSVLGTPFFDLYLVRQGGGA